MVIRFVIGMKLMKTIDYQGSVEQMLYEKATMIHSPINGILELTPLCNMNCDMCFVRLSPKDVEQKGRLRSGAEWIFLAKEICQAGTLFVLLTGEEPLLHPDFCTIYTALKQMGMILTVNTNGRLIDEEWQIFLHNIRLGESISLCMEKMNPLMKNFTIIQMDIDGREKRLHFLWNGVCMSRSTAALRRKI